LPPLSAPKNIPFSDNFSYSWLNSKVMKYFSKMDFFYATFIIFGVQLMGFSLFFEDKKRLFQIATHTSLFLYIAWFLLKNYCIQHFLISISNIIYNNSLFYYIPFMLTHHYTRSILDID